MKAIVILDRDGTVNEAVPYLSRPEQVVLHQGAAQAIRSLRELGLPVVLVTNQSGLARGLFSEQTLDDIHRELTRQLAQEGAAFDGIYYCPHLPGDGCDCRKPAVGLALKAARDFSADLSQSFVIGDNVCDMELGKAIGAQTILVKTGYGSGIEKETAFDFLAADLAAACRQVKEIMERRQDMSGSHSNGAAQPKEPVREKMAQSVRQHLLASAQTTENSAKECEKDVVMAASMLIECFQHGGKVLLCGNGGSAADCQHIAAEFVSVLRRESERPGLPAIALTTDASYLTARANDFGFESVFERQVETLGRAKDVLIAISTSGNSPNVIRAVKAARKCGLKVIGFTGITGGTLGTDADVAIRVPSKSVQHIQEAHIAIAHVMCQIVEDELFQGSNH